MTQQPLAETLGTRRTHRVRVWFGQHLIADHLADHEQASLYAQAMRRRFAGLRVTVDPLDDGRILVPDRGPTPLPSQRLWDLTP